VADLHFETAGAGDPLVLVHAGICDSGMWDPQWRSLAGSHRLLRHDMRGFGRSPLRPGPYSNARDLLDVMDAAGFGRAAVVGTSLGGRVALEVALAAPDRVSALVLVGPGLPGHEWSQAVRDYGAAEDAAIGRGDLDAAAELNVRFWVDGPLRDDKQVDASVRDHVRAMQRRALELQVPVWEEADEELLVPDLGERLGEIRPAGARAGGRGRPAGHPHDRGPARPGHPARGLRDDPRRRTPAEPRAARAVRPARDRVPQCERTGLSERAMASISGSVRSSSSVFCTQ
jgi:pimeloyl-ACP methyl ester carboxylesterase